MNYASIVKSQEWKEIKEYLTSEIIDKPFSIKTNGLSAESIAIEVRASQIAIEKIIKAMRRLERKGKQDEVIKPKSYI